MSSIESVCLIGFGEVGQVLATDLRKRLNTNLQVFDRLFDDEDSIPSRAAASRLDVTSCSSAADASAASDLVISVVTASQAPAAALSVAASLDPGCFYLDLNSVSPQIRQDTAAIVEAAGGRFVEGVVMSPIGPQRIASPILLGGPNAAGFVDEAGYLGFAGARLFSNEIGPASAVKMCRSVVIKGMEALLAESLAAARHYGVETEVLESLDNVLPIEDWPAKSRYMISRSLRHGRRRSEEMRDVAQTVAAAGLEPHMSKAIAQRQEWAAQFADAVEAELPELLDALLESPANKPQPGASGG